MFAAAGKPCGGFSFVFSLRRSSKQHPRCSGLPKGKPQAPRYCFSSSQKSRSAFARCDFREPCEMLSIISAPHSLFPVQPQVCGKLSALAKSVIFARAIRLLENSRVFCAKALRNAVKGKGKPTPCGMLVSPSFCLFPKNLGRRPVLFGSPA